MRERSLLLGVWFSYGLRILCEVRGFASAGPNLDDLVDHFMTVPYARSKVGGPPWGQTRAV